MLQVISANTLCGLCDVSMEEVSGVWLVWSVLAYLNHIARFLIAFVDDVCLI